MTSQKKRPPQPPPARRPQKTSDFDAARPPAEPSSQFGNDSKPKSMFNRIAESGMNFVKDVFNNPTRHDMPSLDLQSQTPQQFNQNEPSEVHAYEPTWEKGQAQPPPQFGGPQEEKNFTKFQSAIRQWNAKEAERAFEKPRKTRGNVVFLPERRSNGWRWIVMLFVLGAIGVVALYTYPFVNEKLINDFKSKVSKVGEFGNDEASAEDPIVINEDDGQKRKKKKRTKKRKRRRKP